MRNKLKNNKDAYDGVVVEGAGIIVGWVLWKKQFETFGWLNEGEFIRENGKNTAILAANWLARLSGVKLESINELVSTICGLDKEESVVYSDEKLQKEIGAIDLQTSINSFHAQLLALWPILKENQQAEFRELFLQREGVFSKSSIGLELNMVKAPYDVLMEKQPLPWPLSLITFPWRSSAIEATW